MAAISLLLFTLLLQSVNSSFSSSVPKYAAEKYVSALGDGGMRNHNSRIALEAWDFCNEVGDEVPSMGSPRLADCTDLSCSILAGSLDHRLSNDGSECEARHLVNDTDNKLAAGDKFPVSGFTSYRDPDLFASEKERYLGSLCKIHNTEEEPWYFWMIMLKNGNFDKNSTLCPEMEGKSVK